jgi:sigma-E factor negative regulatory protein RseA
MKDKISALMDGELEDRPATDAIDALGRDGDALEAWRTYHLIGDAVRDTRLLSEGFSARLARKLAAEPTVLAPNRRPQAAPEPRKWFALSAAASFAAVALVGWLAFAPQQAGEPAGTQMVRAPAPATSVMAEARRPVVVPLPTAANDYLLAHQGFSPRMSLGMAAYVRTVSEPAADSRK